MVWLFGKGLVRRRLRCSMVAEECQASALGSNPEALSLSLWVAIWPYLTTKNSKREECFITLFFLISEKEDDHGLQYTGTTPKPKTGAFFTPASHQGLTYKRPSQGRSCRL